MGSFRRFVPPKTKQSCANQEVGGVAAEVEVEARTDCLTLSLLAISDKIIFFGEGVFILSNRILLCL